MTENIEKKVEKKPEKKKAHFNIVDVIIIVVVVACIGGIVLRVSLIDNFKDSTLKEYVISFEAEGLSNDQYDAFIKSYGESDKDGNFISFADRNESIGRILSVPEAESYIILANGEKVDSGDAGLAYLGVEIKNDLLWNIKGKIVCKGTYTESNGFWLNGETFLAANQTIEVTTKYSQLFLKIISIDLRPAV